MDDDAIAGFGDVSPEAMGRRLRAIRESRDLSQTAFGESVSAKKPSVQAWENGRAGARPLHLREICRRYDVTTDFIILGDWRKLTAARWVELRAAIQAGGGRSGDALEG